MVDGNRKSHFGAVHQGRRYIAIQYLPQQPFTLAITDFHGQGQAPGKFDDAVIEERDPRFQADAHRRPVHLHQNIIREISGAVQILHALHEILQVRPSARMSYDRQRFPPSQHDCIRIVPGG